MRGADGYTEQLFSIRRLEDFVPSDHPLRPIREMVNEALARLDGVFARMYEPDVRGGRPSIAPEKLARAMLLQVFYSIRSERQLVDAAVVGTSCGDDVSGSGAGGHVKRYSAEVAHCK